MSSSESSVESSSEPSGAPSGEPSVAPSGERFRFRPRYRPLAAGAVLMGLLLIGYGVVTRESTALAAAMGLLGVTLGLLYLASPVWRLEVVVYPDRLEVQGARGVRFSLPWDQVEELIASPDTRTCFVRGDTPERSLLVPGPGAGASYDIVGKERLFALLRERVPAERIREVDSLKAWKKAQRSGGDQAGEDPVP